MQTWIFRVTGVAFFALQAGILLHLLRERPAGADGGRSVEIVWTLVPAAILAALVLMLSGGTQPPWSRVRGGASGPLEPPRFVPVEVR